MTRARPAPSLPDPATAADLTAWSASLGIPGVYDAHVHFMPEPVMQRVWEYFAAAGPLVGREWPVVYRGSDTDRVAWLRSLGVRRFTSLPYAHRPGIATYLNEWAREFAATVPETVWSATCYPEPGVERYVADLVAAGVGVFKVHVQVGDFDLRDPLLDPVWGTLSEAGVPVVVHAGSGPVGNAHTGPGPLRGVLRRHPTLPAVVAHLGAPEYAEFLALAEEFDQVRLDTTMVFTDFFEAMAPFPPDLLPRLAALGDKVLLGSDFPNIPHRYGAQLAALQRLGLGERWLAKVCWHNAHALLG